MINCADFFEIFKKEELTFFTGVPDSTFKDWINFLSERNGKDLTNIIACNECEATAIAAGYYLSTGKVAVLYMQNAGLGKAVNPLTSLCNKEVYSIPLVLMIGWRGVPGEKDEPQHIKMGKITLPLLDLLDIPYQFLPENIFEAERVIKSAKKTSLENKSPTAIIIRKGLFEACVLQESSPHLEMYGEEAIKTIVDSFNEEIIVSTTGKISRNLFEYRIAKGQHPRDFYTVGSMGCASSIAHSIALTKPDKKVFIFDGDGAVLMQMGALATIGHYKLKNLYHIVFDNNAHDSTGGQPTASNTINFPMLAISVGYKSAAEVRTKGELIDEIEKMRTQEGPYLLSIKINKGTRKDLGRPTTTPSENKTSFMDFLGN